MVNTVKDRKMNKDTVSMEHTHTHTCWHTGLGAYRLGEGSPLMMAEQMLGRAEMSRGKVPARTKTGKTPSQPLFLSLSFLSPLDPPPCVSQSHTFCELFYCLSLKRLIYTFVRKIPELFPLNAIKLPFNEAFGRPPSHLKSKVSH